MFVLKKTYDALKKNFEATRENLTSMAKTCDYYANRSREAVSKYNKLVDEYNKLLESKSGHTVVTSNDFSKKDIDTLLRLCHPDKHDGKESATRMTQMLLEMRNK